jgi:hypothetical protein
MSSLSGTGIEGIPLMEPSIGRYGMRNLGDL